MKIRRPIALVGTLAMLSQPAIGSATLVSTFDSDAGGWSVGSSQGTSGVDGFAWDGTGGNPAGAITATDIGDQGGWWFIAPAVWAGDWRPYLGGTISFDVRAASGQDTTPNPPVEAIVFLLADGGRLRAKSAAGAAIGTWVTAEVDLVEDQFNLTGSGYASFDQALEHVTGLVIPGDFVYRQQDKTWLDNVRVTAVPEPGSVSLLLLGLVAVALVRTAVGFDRRGGHTRR